MFKDFDNYLLSSFSEDYWSDEGIGFAEVKLCEFSNEDWLIINNDWRDRDSFWLIRCANVLGDFNDSKSMNLLLSFLSVDNVEVQIAALDSINSLLSMGMISKDFDMDLISNIKKIKSPSIVVNAVLNSLGNKLKK